MTALTIGSLFSGIGGLELGLERGIGNGAHTIWQVEQSEYCRAVLAKHWPDATRYDDVRTVGRSNLAPVDVLCGGFPCQDISQAGAKTGILGGRSGLWGEFHRIICELRPRYVVVENVPDLVHRGLGTVLGHLAALGYDAEWDMLSAEIVGAPQRRARIFIVGYADVASSHARTSTGGQWSAIGESGRWPAEPPVGRVADGLPKGLARRCNAAALTALGNAVVPQVAEVVGRLIAEREAALLQGAA